MSAEQTIRSLGFIGVGALAEYTLMGLRRGGFIGPVYLSPRNREMATKLATQCDAQVLDSNQAVADASDCLVISTRPAHCLAALQALSLAPGQLLVSVVAGMPLTALQAAVPADVTLVRAMPISAAQVGASPTLIYPAHTAVETLFQHCGDSISVATESAFEQGTVLACVHTWYFALFEQLIQSTSQQHLPADKAKALVLGMANGAASLAQHKTASPGEIAEAIASEGTFSKQGLDLLKQQQAFAPWDQACQLLIAAMKQ